MSDLLTAVRAAAEIPAFCRYSVRIRKPGWIAGDFVAMDALPASENGRSRWVHVRPDRERPKGWFFGLEDLLADDWEACTAMLESETDEIARLTGERKAVVVRRIQAGDEFRRVHRREMKPEEIPFTDELDRIDGLVGGIVWGALSRTETEVGTRAD